MLPWPDLIGVIGATLAISAYLATQMRWLNSDDVRFPALNLAASALIAISLAYSFNLASALMELFWAIISLIGIAQWLRHR